MKNLKNKLSILKVARRLSQLMFLIFLPTLFSEVMSGVKTIYTAIIGQNFNISILTGLVGTVAILLFTLLMGRFFCGWMCMFGTLGDLVYSIRKLIIKKNFVIPEQIDRYMKYIKYIVLAVFVIAIWTLNIPILSDNSSSGIIFIVLFGLIAIAASLVERFFCRYLCPMGALFSILSKISLGKIDKPTQKCGSCKVCTKNCAMGIDLYNREEVRGGECINCMRCVEVCPRKNTAYTMVGAKIKPILAGVITVSLIAVIYNFANFDTSIAKANTVTEAIANQVVEQGAQYKDGTYQGSGTGFKGKTTTVSVVITGGKITSIKTVSTGDDAPFYNKAYNTVTQAIISSQSSSVDAVSGATYSSKGIMTAVTNALNNAKVTTAQQSEVTQATVQQASTVSEATQATTKQASGVSEATQATTKQASGVSEATQTTTQQASGVSEATQATTKQTSTATQATTKQASTASSTTATVEQTIASQVNSQGNTYKDGTYQGSGTGFRNGTTTVSVVIEGGKITSIKTVSTKDDAPFYNKAFNTIVQKIINTQSSSVDAVSGATYSSKGIKAAVANALTKAKA
jgi:uncharacterized protein with FMN-binding domain